MELISLTENNGLNLINFQVHFSWIFECEIQRIFYHQSEVIDYAEHEYRIEIRFGASDV